MYRIDNPLKLDNGISILNAGRSAESAMLSYSPIAFLGLQESSGAVAYDLSSNSIGYPGANVVVNGDFDTDTDWTKDAAVTIASGKATWAGTQAGNADLTATVAPLTSGVRYEVTIITSGITAGTVTPVLGSQAGTARSTNGTFIEEFTANDTALIIRGDSDFTGSVEAVIVRPANPLNGDHSNITVGQAGQYRVPVMASYNGTTSYTNIYSAALNTIIPRNEGTIGIVFQMDAVDLADGASRTALTIETTTATNQLRLLKPAANTLRIVYRGGGTNITLDTSYSSSNIALLAFTWSVSNDLVAGYLNDTQFDTDTGVNAFTGDLNSAACLIGSLSPAPSNLHKGKLALAFIYNEEKTANEMKRLAKSIGVA